MSYSPNKNDSAVTMTDGLHLDSKINSTYDNDTDLLQKTGNATNIEEDEVYVENTGYMDKYVCSKSIKFISIFWVVE